MIRKYFKIPALVLILFLIYAIIRYNIFKGISFSHLPLFIFNKSISASAVVLIGLSFYPGESQKRRFYGLSSYFLSFIHVYMSMLVLNPVLFGKFFSGDSLNFQGEIAVLFGIIAFAVLSLSAITSLLAPLGKSHYYSRLKVLNNWVMLFIAFHLVFTGLGGWFDPYNWPGYLPPITLISLVALLVLMAAAIIRKKSWRQGKIINTKTYV